MYIKLEEQAERFIDWAPSRGVYGMLLGICLGLSLAGVGYHSVFLALVPLLIFFVGVGIGRWLYYVQYKV